MRYLSPEWLDAASEAAGGAEGADGDRLVIEHVVESGPDGDVVYHVVLGAGGATIRAGAVPQPDVTFRQSYATAAAVAQGARSAKEAFLAGEVRVGGDVTRLIGRDRAFAALESVLAGLAGRRSTDVPEMPEVQAHAERLTAEFGGAVLERFTPISFTALKTFDPPPDDAVGRPLDRVDRRAKYLLLRFGDRTFVVHLMQGGRLRVDEKQSAKPRGGLARWRFEDGRALLLTEAGTEKRAGVWVVAGEPLDQPPVDDLGPEASELDASALRERLAGTSQRLHGLLRDQGAVAGIGRRLANETCHRAKLSPFAKSGSLTDEEVARLVAAIQEAIEEGLEYERGRDDMSSSKERPGNVHHRTGEPCPVCGDEVRAVEYRSYTVNYCATCQTGGKILADNTTSKFLK